MFKLSYLWPLGDFSNWLLISLTQWLLSTFLPFGVTGYPRLDFCISYTRPEINHFFRNLGSFQWKLWVIIIFSLWFVCGMICIRVCQYFWSRVCLFNSHLFCGDIYNCIRIFCVAGNRKSDSSWHKREFSFFFFLREFSFLLLLLLFFSCSCKVQIFSSREAFSFFLSLMYLS